MNSNVIQSFTFALNDKKSNITLCNCDYLEADFPQGFLLCVTDPPYGQTANSWDIKLDFEAFWGKLLPLATDRTIYTIMCMMPFSAELYLSNKKMWKQELIWKKNYASNFFDANVKPLRVHENIFVFCKNSRYNSTYNPQLKENCKPYTTIIRKEDKKLASPSKNWDRIYKESNNVNKTTRFPTTVLEGLVVKENERMHPTQKAVSLFEWLVKTYSNAGEMVIDPFSGSGTTAYGVPQFRS